MAKRGNNKHYSGKRIRKTDKNYKGIFWIERDVRNSEEKINPQTGRVFYGQFNIQNSRVVRKLGCERDGYTLDWARTRRDEICSGIREGKIKFLSDLDTALGKVKGITLDGVFEEYVRDRKNRGKRTLANDIRLYNFRIKPAFGKKPAQSLTTGCLEQFKSMLEKATSQKGVALKPATVKHYLVLLRQIIYFGMKKGMLSNENNPFVDFELPRLNNHITDEYLTKPQMRKLIEVCSEWNELYYSNVIALAILTGLRKGELFGLKWSDIDFERKQMVIRQQKNNQISYLPLTNTALNVLRSQQQLGLNSEYVFCNVNTGKKLTEIRTTWKRIKKEVGIRANFRFHGLRHAYGTWLAMNDFEAMKIMALMRHNSIHMTMRYINLAPTLMNSDMAKLDKDLGL